MKIEHLIASLDEARRNNYGREISNAQGQALGKQLATNAPGAQQALAQAQGVQATNQPDPRGDTLGQTTPAQRLAAKKAASTTTPPIVPPPAETPATAPAAETPPTTEPTTPAADTTAPATTEPAAKKAGFDWKKGIQGVGDVASQVAGGLAQVGGAAYGGFGRGYHTARQGKKFGGIDAMHANTYAGDTYQQGGAAGGSGAAGDAEVAQLRADIASITGRLNKAGIAEKKQR